MPNRPETLNNTFYDDPNSRPDITLYENQTQEWNPASQPQENISETQQFQDLNIELPKDLKQILEQLKADWEILKQPTPTFYQHPAWKKFQQISSRYTYYTWVPIINHQYPEFNFVIIYYAVHGTILPKHFCKAFVNAEGTLCWLEEEIFNEWKKQGEIKWCPVSKIWAPKDSFITINSLNPKTKETIQITFALGGKKYNNLNYEKCQFCKYNWIITDLIFNKHTDSRSCLPCSLKLKDQKNINPPHTLETVFAGYHSHRERISLGNTIVPGSWTFYIQRLNTIKDQDSLPMGLEIELQCKIDSHKSVAWKIYQAQLEHNPLWHNFYTEGDGSLAPAGIEIITNPMTLGVHQQYWEKMLPELRKYCVGWNIEKYGADEKEYLYGIHITFHRRYWTDFQLARLTKFLNTRDNKDLIIAIAQRKTIYGGHALGCSTNQLNQLLVMEKKGIKNSGRSTVHIKAGIPHVELRMFQSTLNHTSFMKNLEFIDAFHKWVKETPFNITQEAFLQWLHKTPLQYRYPHLLAYLGKLHFPCKYHKPWNNPWVNTFQNKGQQPLFNFTPIQQIEVDSLEDEADVLDYTNE